MDEKLLKKCSSASPTRKRETEIMFEISSPPGLNGQDLFVKGQHICMDVGKGNFYSSLVGVKSRATTMEFSVWVPRETTTRSSSTTLGHIPEGLHPTPVIPAQPCSSMLYS